MMAVRRFLSRLRGDASGASVIEFALFAPVLGMMVMGITDFAMGYAQKLRIEQAIYRTLEKIAVGTVQSDYQTFKAEAAAAAGVSQSAVTIDNWLECNEVRSAEPFTGNCATGERTARYVSITISTSYTPEFNYGPWVTNAQGVVPITSSSSLRIQ